MPVGAAAGDVVMPLKCDLVLFAVPFGLAFILGSYAARRATTFTKIPSLDVAQPPELK